MRRAPCDGACYSLVSKSGLPKGMQMTMEIVTHVVGSERPSVINDLVILYM